jgi:osmotically-inducible protein OsmY
MPDKQLRQDVLDELDFEPSIDASEIGVAVKDGVVALTGHVPSYAQKLGAERAVWRVKGVKAIAQELQVHYPDARRLGDDDIARRAVSILGWDASVPADTIRVTVQDGWVTLSGEVRWQYQRMAAESDVRKLSGVVGISNRIGIAPLLEAEDVQQRIEQALRRHAEVEAHAVRVTVQDGGAITLDGQVDNWDERRAVERAAWSAPGVRSVEDRITIA